MTAHLGQNKLLLVVLFIFVAVISCVVGKKNNNTFYSRNCNESLYNGGGGGWQSHSHSRTDDALTVDHQWNQHHGLALPNCESPSDNTRGVYSAHFAPCQIKFHKVDTSIKNQHGTMYGHLPTVCTNENKIGLRNTKRYSVKQYLTGWKDECVGNFPRCYSVPKHQDIYLDLLCRKKWELPEGTTHISVSCEKDMKLKADKIVQDQNSTAMYVDPMTKVQEKATQLRHKRWLEIKMFVTVLVWVLVLLCVGFTCFSYLWVVKPYINLSKHQKV